MNDLVAKNELDISFEGGIDDPKQVVDLPIDTLTSTEDLVEIEESHITLPNGTKLHYSRSNDSTLYLKDLNLLGRSLQNVPCLPTEILFKTQDIEALAVTRKYIEGITEIVKVITKHGSNPSIASYSFRLPHLIHLEAWKNVVVRLQFATSLKTILDTLNDNLTPGVTSRWGVLEYKDGRFMVNDQEIKLGSSVDVFTTSEELLSKVLFSGHSVLNCKNIDGDTAPVFHYNVDQMLNMSQEDLIVRAQAKTPDGTHLLGTDAWSFLQGLLYRISTDDEDVIEITTDILTKLDYSPEINLNTYKTLATRLVEEELPYGLNVNLHSCLRDYYCKDEKTFDGFLKMINHFYDNQDQFRKTLNATPYVKALKGEKSFIITGIYDLLRLIDGNSKLLRVKLVKANGEIVDAVTVTRPLTLPIFGVFNRFNPSPIYFQTIEYVGSSKVKTDFMSRLSEMVSNKKVNINLDNFVLTDEIIRSEDIVGYINTQVKAYYFGDDSSLEKDDKFAMYHTLSKKFKRIAKGLE